MIWALVQCKSGAWIVNFNDGNVNNDNKDNGNYVRCVRQ